jgi:hypothetical protein
MRLQIGSIVQFSYSSKRSHDAFPRVLVLHNGWRSPDKGNKLLVHGLNLNYLTADETNLLRFLIDPGFQLKYFENMVEKNPSVAQEYTRIIASAANAVITSPHDFYIRVVRPFIQPRGWDPYRLYDPKLMINVKVLQTQRQMLGEQKSQFFGYNPPGAGKDEKEVLADLAMRQIAQQKGQGKALTPQEQQFIRKLRGKALQLFQNYKSRFQAMQGPKMATRGMNFAGNQKGPKNPGWMKDEL